MEGFTDALIEWLEEKITGAKKELEDHDKEHNMYADPSDRKEIQLKAHMTKRPRLEQRERLLLELLAEVKTPKTFEVYSECPTTFYWKVTARSLPEAIAEIKEKLQRGEIEGCDADDVTEPDNGDVVANLNGWERD